MRSYFVSKSALPLVVISAFNLVKLYGIFQDPLKINAAADVRPGFYSKLNPRAKETISRSTLARSSVDINSDSLQQFSKDRPRTCGICRRSETALNPILICSSCKVFALYVL